MKDKHRLAGTLFVLPAVLLVTIFFLLPLIFLVYTSLTNWTAGDFRKAQWVGMANYLKLFMNPGYWQAICNTLIWIGANIFIHIPLCIIVAMILSRKPRGWKILRTVYFFPQVVAAVSLAMMWMFIYNVSFGIINMALKSIGLESLALNWLGNPNTALPALICTWIFNIGFFMIIFLAQIGTISQDVYEAAAIDGATKIQQDWYITLPMLRGTIGTSVLLSVTLTFKTFDIPYMLTNGGPGTSTEILSITMYKRFLDNAGGVANAVGITMLILGIISILIVKAFNRNKEAEQ